MARMAWLLLCTIVPGVFASSVKASQYDHVIYISVDGLRGDAFGVVPPKELPGFTRLFTQGATTFNARCDADESTSITNHIGMLTGRKMYGKNGHQWNLTEDIAGVTMQSWLGTPVSSIFDVARSNGVYTAMAYAKDKFGILNRSWGSSVDVLELTKGKPDGTSATAGSNFVKNRLREWMPSRSLVFWHFQELDYAGHMYNWTLKPDSKYISALRTSDSAIVGLLDMLDQHPSLRQRTAIVLTSDHGGGADVEKYKGRFFLHLNNNSLPTVIVPFVIWTGDNAACGDLFTCNPQRQDHGTSVWDFTTPPTIRNLDGANLVLSLLSLPPVPGSTVNEKQDLRFCTGTKGQCGGASGTTPLTSSTVGMASIGSVDSALFAHIWKAILLYLVILQVQQK